MDTSTVIFIILSLLGSICIAYFQYYYKEKDTSKIKFFLAILRAAAIFLLLLLLINPSIEKVKLVNTKPKLSLLVDNSSSTNFFQQDSVVKKLTADFQSNQELNNRFDINYYSFGDEFKLNDSLSFDESQTNISSALKSINNIHKNENNAVVLVSDGNQTLGNDYEYANITKPVYPVVIGDTIQYEDISIAQLNVNKYSFVNNQFPLESLILYDGTNPVKARYTIENRGSVVFSKVVNLSPDKTTETVNATIKSEKEGVNFYRARIAYLEGEKNTNNNTKSFSVEVIDKQSQILIVSSIYHPDLGTLKKSIESDQQRKATIKLISDIDVKIDDFQLVVLYQPNQDFKKLMDEITKKKQNYFLVSGANTEWNFLNNQNLGVQKNSIFQTENYGASYNAGFLTFSQKDIGFQNFPPLVDLFGEVRMTIPNQVLLYQNINGFSSKQPLLATTDVNNHKGVFLFGEGLWKWRSNSFLTNNSFENFDEFIGNMIQYASSKKIRERLNVDIESIYNANQIINIGAFYVDENYQFDDRATLIFTIKNKETNETNSYPFSLSNNSYQLSLESLEPAEYSYTVSVENQSIRKSGNFKVNTFEVEKQFTNANSKKLSRLAIKTKGTLFYPSQSNVLFNQLLHDKRYVVTQKSVTKQEVLIDWKWILFLLVGLLSIEWFTRKYYGKI